MRIGLMSFAHVHAASYARLLRAWPGVEVVATDPDHGRRPGETGGPSMAADLGVDYVADYAALLAGGCDAVIVCAENVEHRRLVELAAAAGAHVLCEKPIATTLADADAMTAACAAAGVQLMIAHPVRFAPAFVGLREVVAAGTLGEIVSIAGTNNGRIPRGDRAWFVDPAAAGGGALTDHLVHVLDLLDALWPDSRVTSVYAVANRLLHPDAAVETGGLAALRLELVSADRAAAGAGGDRRELVAPRRLRHLGRPDPAADRDRRDHRPGPVRLAGRWPSGVVAERGLDPVRPRSRRAAAGLVPGGGRRVRDGQSGRCGRHPRTGGRAGGVRLGGFRSAGGSALLSVAVNRSGRGA